MIAATAAWIDPARFIHTPGLAQLWDALPAARLVGGIVRDLLADLPTADTDLASPLPPDLAMRVLAQAGIKTIPTGQAHGTITALCGGRHFEITTLRRDLETDGRHAVVAYTADWRQDAARRDFTFNAMSLDRDGTLHDYFGGAADLAAGIVRFVGDPATRLAEDYLRLLRFFRFHARFARQQPDAELCRALADAVPGLADISVERVWSELKRILGTTAPLPSLDLMQRLGVLHAVLPDGTALDRLAALIAHGAPANPLLRLAALFDGSPDGLANRLRLSGEERQYLLALDGPVPDDTADDRALRQALADTPRDALIARTWLAGRGNALRQRLASLPAPIFPLQGRDLLAAGIPPGPAMGQRLATLRRWWWDGGCTADHAACLAELARRQN